MKIIKTYEEALNHFIDNEDLWYCLGDFLSKENLEKGQKIDSKYLESESKSGVCCMSCIGYSQGDSEEDIEAETHYFLDENWYYYIHPKFKERFLDLYDRDRYDIMVREIDAWTRQEDEPILVESPVKIDGMHQITCYTVSRLVEENAVFCLNDVPLTKSSENESWINWLMPIINEFKDGNEDPLDGDEVDKLVHIIKCKINLQEGNITPMEYEEALDFGPDMPLGFSTYSIIEKTKEIRNEWTEEGGDSFNISPLDIQTIVDQVTELDSISFDGIEDEIRKHFKIQ